MELNIAVGGLKDAGKSMIANGLVGHKVFKEGDSLIRHENLTVTPHSWKDNDRNFQITVYDAHGFGDVGDNADQYKAEKSEKNRQDVDLLLYTISVKEAKSMIMDKIILEQLKNVFDPTVWNHSVIVLTFANAIIMEGEVKHGSASKSQVAFHYRAIIKEWHEKIQEVLRDVGLSCDIPIIAAGSQYRFSLLDDNKYWLTDLYHVAMNRTVAEKKDVLQFVNCHRFLASSKVQRGHFETDIWRQPLVVAAEEPIITTNMKKLGLVGAVGAGGVSGVTGAGIGATIGALAIGLPTFGVAAGAGLVIGGAIGGAVGIAVGAAAGVGSAKVIERIERRRNN